MTEPQRDEEPSYEPPPEGANCHEHPESFAVITCPRCGHYACLSCWHEPIGRCHACLLRDPLAAGDPIPFEDPSKNPIRRFFGTFASALGPGRSAPGIARGGIGPAARFGFLSFVPVAALAGIIPFTSTLLFEPGLAWRTIGTPTDAQIGADVAFAAGLGLFVFGAQALVLGTVYVSLVRAYLGKGEPSAAARVMLYRAWLLPMTRLYFDLAGWIAPSAEVAMTLLFLAIVPLVLLLSAMVAVARMGAGVGRFTSFVVVLVPVLVMMFGQLFLDQAIAPWLPDSAAISEAARAADEAVAPAAAPVPGPSPGAAP